MPIVNAAIPTDRAGRYLAQLCRHLSQMSRMRYRPGTGHGSRKPPAVEDVDWSDTAGTIRFSHGTCTLRATADALALRIDAEDEDTLQRLQEGVARRLETIGRRDGFTVQWQRSDAAPDRPTGDAATVTSPRPADGTRRGRRLGRTLILVGVAALAILVHVGLFGGALAASPWASWGTNIVLAVILLKVVTVGAHVVLGRVAFRHREIFRRHRHNHAGAPVSADNPDQPREHAS